MQVEALRRNRQSFLKIARETGLSRATVARAGKAKGLSRLSNLDPKIAIVCYEKTLPGEMIHIDIKKLGRGAHIRSAVGDSYVEHQPPCGHLTPPPRI
jgi:hypothetical protein